MDLDLLVPVAFGGQTYEKLTLRDPTAADFEYAATAATPVGVTIQLIARAASVDVGVVRGLCARDLRRIEAQMAAPTVPAIVDGDLRLSDPVKLPDGSQISALKLREPTAGDLERSANASSGVHSNILLVAFASDASPAVVRMLKKCDFDAAVAYLSDFLADGPGIGASQSPG